MSTRKQESGSEKRKKKRRQEQLVGSLRGSLDKFVTKPKINSQNEVCLDDNENITCEENKDFAEKQSLNSIEEPIDTSFDEHLEDPVNVFVDKQVENSTEERGGNVVGNNAANPLDIFDPANWRIIDSKLRDILVEKGPIRVDDIQFPKDTHTRHFTTSYYIRILPNGEKQDRRWLIYSKSVDRVFCFCCKLFSSKSSHIQLVNEGVNDWRNLGSKLKSHEASSEHITNIITWADLELRLVKNKTLDHSIQESVKKEKAHWKSVLTRIIAIVEELATSNTPFRGTNEKIYEENNGKFLRDVQMIAKFDPVMQEHIRRITNGETHTHYLGHNTQNELVHLIACEIKNKIIKKVQKAKYFSVILDCTPDVSRQEQMSVILRCVDISSNPVKVEEFFLEFLKIDDTTGKGILEELLNFLNVNKLDINNIRGQGYDNGSNMKGIHQGVQSRLRELNPRAFYTPCASHNLNLVLCDMANCCARGRDFFGAIQRIYTLFSSSTKRWKILKDNVPKLTVKSLSQTRWESRIESVKPIRYQTLEIRDALLDLIENSDKDASTENAAKGLVKCELESFEFLVSLTIWYDILSNVNCVSKTLQYEDMQIDIAIHELETLLGFLNDYRVTGFDLALNSAKDIAKDMGIEPTFTVKRVIRRKRHFDESTIDDSVSSPQESFRTEYFIYIMDQAISSITSRFEQFKRYREIFGFLIDLKLLKSMDDKVLESHCIELESHLRHGSLSDIDGCDLFSELQVLKVFLPNEVDTPFKILNHIKDSYSYPNTCICYRVILTIPVSVASAERSFSKLKLIKTYLRSTMSQERLTGLATISIEKELVNELDYDELINTFASVKSRRKNFT